MAGNLKLVKTKRKAEPSRDRRTKSKPVDVHIPYICDCCGGKFKDEDDYGRAAERKSWDVSMLPDGGLDFRRRRKLSCLRCEANGEADKYTRKWIATLVPLYAGTGRRAKKGAKRG
jgi:hypothetical protein